MGELTPWERAALKFLHAHPGRGPVEAATRQGIKQLARKGLAEPVDGTLFFRLTPAGVAEHDRRARRSAA